MKELLKELESFKNNLDKIMPSAIEKIKRNIIEMHSLRQEYNYDNDCPRKVSTKLIVKGLEVSLFINTGCFYSFIKDETVNNFKYSNMSSVKTDKGGIADGKVCWLIWEAIKDDIDLSMYPNFNVPKFVNENEL